LAILQSVYPFVQCKIICIITVADCPLACCVVHCRSLSAGVDINSEDGIRVWHGTCSLCHDVWTPCW